MSRDIQFYPETFTNDGKELSPGIVSDFDNNTLFGTKFDDFNFKPVCSFNALFETKEPTLTNLNFIELRQTSYNNIFTNINNSCSVYYLDKNITPGVGINLNGDVFEISNNAFNPKLPKSFVSNLITMFIYNKDETFILFNEGEKITEDIENENYKIVYRDDDDYNDNQKLISVGVVFGPNTGPSVIIEYNLNNISKGEFEFKKLE